MYDLKRTKSTPEASAEYAQFLGDVFDNDQLFTAEYIDWLYRQNPQGPVVGFDAIFEGEVVAHYVTIPVSAKIDGQVEKGLLSLNTATSPEHTGKGLFTKLATATYQAGADEGYKFVVGVANQNSTHGFVKKLGFELVRPLDARIGFMGPYKATKDADFKMHWDEASLQWRLNKPSANYWAEETGYFAKTPYPLTRVFLGSGSSKASNSSFKKAFALFDLEIGLSEEGRSGLSFEIPKALRPSPLNLIFKDLTESHRSLKDKSIRFQAMDFDAF